MAVDTRGVVDLPSSTHLSVLRGKERRCPVFSSISPMTRACWQGFGQHEKCAMKVSNCLGREKCRAEIVRAYMLDEVFFFFFSGNYFFILLIILIYLTVRSFFAGGCNATADNRAGNRATIIGKTKLVLVNASQRKY